MVSLPLTVMRALLGEGSALRYRQQEWEEQDHLGWND